MDDCGTYAAWARHLRNKETPCDACRAARIEYQRGRKAARAALPTRIQRPDDSWRDDARCIDLSEVFVHDHFSGTHERNTSKETVCAECAQALVICGGCPVRAECLEASLLSPLADQVGVWGGMLAGDRRRLIRTRKVGAR